MKKEVGIDIGNHSIKLIELEERKGHITLTKCFYLKITNGDKKSALKELLEQSKSTLKRAVTSIAGPSVIVRYIEMPPMKKEELKSAIKFEAEKYIPFHIDESIIDFAILNKTSIGTQRILLVAAKRQDVINLIEFLKEFGLEPAAIDIDSLAVLNSFRHTKVETTQDNVYALVNIGARFSNMNILIGQDLYFTRDIILGGMDITTRIKDGFGIGFDEAELLKIEPRDKREDVARTIIPVLEKLASQIKLSLDYFETQYGRNVDRLYVSGGSSYLFNMVDFLKEGLGIDVIMWNPFEGITALDLPDEARHLPAQFAVAMGLALREVV